MSDLVRMRAKKPWRNLEFEGHVSIGQKFNTPEDRARELERIGFAERVVEEEETQQVSVPSVASAPSREDRREQVEFARKDRRRS